jgi:hypothetical protein
MGLSVIPFSQAVHAAAVILAIEPILLAQLATLLEAILLFKIGWIEPGSQTSSHLFSHPVDDESLLVWADGEGAGEVIEFPLFSNCCRSSQSDSEAYGAMRPTLPVSPAPLHSSGPVTRLLNAGDDLHPQSLAKIASLPGSANSLLARIDVRIIKKGGHCKLFFEKFDDVRCTWGAAHVKKQTWLRTLFVVTPKIHSIFPWENPWTVNHPLEMKAQPIAGHQSILHTVLLG